MDPLEPLELLDYGRHIPMHLLGRLVPDTGRDDLKEYDRLSFLHKRVSLGSQ